MARGSSLTRVGWEHSLSKGARAVALTLGALALGCLPERQLASYAEGNTVDSAPAANTSSVASSVPPTDDPLGADSDDSLESGPRDAGVAPVESAGGSEPAVEPDAAPALVCRAECECERRGELDFMFCATSVSFAIAVERCAAAGGALASVDDAEQNAWLTQQMVARDADDFWLSGTDAEVEGVWRWADGRVFYPAPEDAGASFAPWDDQQPNDLNGEDCMRSVGGLWRDLACTLELGYVCQG